MYRLDYDAHAGHNTRHTFDKSLRAAKAPRGSCHTLSTRSLPAPDCVLWAAVVRGACQLLADPTTIWLLEAPAGELGRGLADAEIPDRDADPG
jgi:hypothetical protein